MPARVVPKAANWASMLMRMYLMWAEKQGFKVKELDYNAGDVAGIKSISLEIEGNLLTAF